MEKQCEYLAVLKGELNRSVQSARVDEAGHLILTMSDGQQVDVGCVRGELSPEQIAQLNAAIAYAVERAEGALPLSGGTLTGNLHLPDGGGVVLGSGAAAVIGYGQTLMLQAGSGAAGLYLRQDSRTGLWTIDISSDRLTMDGGTVAGLRDPENPGEAATKGYVDSLMGWTDEELSSLADYGWEVSK